MRQLIIFLLAASLFFLSGNLTKAQLRAVSPKTDNETVGLLPDSPFYFLKTFWEKVQESLALDPSKKAELNLRFAQRRLLETQKMCEKDKCDIAERWMQLFQERLNLATTATEQVQNQGKDVSALVQKLAENLARQQTALDRVLEQVPESAQEAVSQAQENSAKGLQQAIESLQKETPGKMKK